MIQSSTTKTLLSICKQEMNFFVHLNIWKTLTNIQIELMSRSIPLHMKWVTKEEYQSNETIKNQNNALPTKKCNKYSCLL